MSDEVLARVITVAVQLWLLGCVVVAVWWTVYDEIKGAKK